jgi:elongation of very long chain fatty acids protein 6
MSDFQIFFDEYNYERTKQWLANHEGFLLKCVAFYIVSIFAIKYVMRDRKPFNLEKPLIMWNAFLATFSLLGFLYTFPFFLKTIREYGIARTFTHVHYQHTNPLAGYWSFLWVASKVPEFVDTYFIVLRKKPLMFMHWFHHAITGYYALINFSTDNAHLSYGVWANYGIHAMMYTYYCAVALKFRVPSQVAQIITTSQMVQFLIVIYAMVGAQYYASTGMKVAATSFGLFLGHFTMWAFMLLWTRFYVNRYVNNCRKTSVQQPEINKALSEKAQ